MDKSIEHEELCQRCNKPGKRRRQNTAYVNDDLNFKVLCEECQEEADEYWKAEWKAYYDTVM